MRLCELSPSSRVQTLAEIVESREILDICCAVLLETVLRKFCKQHRATHSALIGQEC